MDSMKMEPDTDGELYSASYSESRHIDIKEEVKTVLVSFPHMKTRNDVNWLSVFLSFHNHMQ
jgi:hypothetical protein